jgi:hypothetical protein
MDKKIIRPLGRSGGKLVMHPHSFEIPPQRVSSLPTVDFLAD